MEKIAALRSDLDELIKKFQDDSGRHKRLNRLLKYLLFALSGCGAILSAAALKFTNLQTPLNLAVVVVSVGAGIVSSIDGIRKPAELWILERRVFHALSDLKRDLDYHATDADLKVDTYFDRMQRILTASDEQWNQEVKHDEPQ